MIKSQKIALIIGASSDIGKNIVSDLIEKGYFILFHFNNKRDEEFIEINKLHLSEIKADLSNMAGLNHLIKKISTVKYINAIVVCASLHEKNIQNLPTEDAFYKISFLNNFAPIYIIQQLIPLLLESNNPSVTFISSTYSHKLGNIKNIFYSSTKTSLSTISRIFAREFKPCRFNIVIPGYVETENYLNSRKDKKMIIRDKKISLLNKLTDIKNVSNSVIFLIENTDMNNSSLVIDGGIST